MYSNKCKQSCLKPPAIWALTTGSIALAVTLSGPVAFAQEQEEVEEVEDAAKKKGRARTGSAAVTETIKITGTKKTGGELAEDAPISVTAVGEEQMEALQFRDIESLTFSVPNVSFDSVGTVKGVANFSIRGLGANSSIPSIDPTVGLFVNGVYFGSNSGAVLDTFDLEAIEVLRGPQGILFGRNVTGGAVLLRTKRPGDTYSASAQYNMENGFVGEGGFEYRGYGAVDLPILPDLLKIRLTGQYRSDTGWFTNQAPVEGTNPVAPETEDTQFGYEDTWLIRPTVTFTPFDALTLHVMYERGETDAEGPASQSSARAGTNPNTGASFAGPFNDFDFSIDQPGFIEYQWNHLFTEALLDAGEAGNFTYIFGFRTVDSLGSSDIDSQPISLFNADLGLDVDHFSNELRHEGRWFDGFLETTIGLYQFAQTIRYRERRLLLGVAVPDDPQAGGVDSTYGGNQDQLSLGGFAQLTFNVLDNLALIAGGRITWEEKEADVVTFGADCPRPTDSLDCERISNVDPDNDPLAFTDKEDWTNFSPKLGVTWTPDDDHLIYGHWTQGFRSGGFNLRNTSADPEAVPGPFDPEQQNAGEIGYKGALLDRKIRLGLAVFYTRMDDLQREINAADEGSAVVQIIRNTADANIYGFEAEATVIPISNLVFTGSFGYTDASYDTVRFDLNEDGVIDSEDTDLQLPRLANITSNLGAIYDIDFGDSGILTLRSNWAYRDDSFFTDSNFGQLPDGHVIDASIAYTFGDIDLGSSYIVAKITLYGRNLANEAFLGGQTVLPPILAANTPPLGGNFSPLKEGRNFGLSLRVDWE